MNGKYPHEVCQNEYRQTSKRPFRKSTFKALGAQHNTLAHYANNMHDQ